MKLKNIKSKEVLRILQKQGFEIRRQSGTHVILRKGDRTVVVPVHRDIMPIGTLKSIEKQSEVDFRELLS
ncbi:type II toxin-antitoxin system HicA family toxin [Candidatus Pacearchaeota archaeon]|nr:type II toxin-antitoxin system HicA family toxin [Candidatus Pacearchaeota archaeon]